MTSLRIDTTTPEAEIDQQIRSIRLWAEAETHPKHDAGDYRSRVIGRYLWHLASVISDGRTEEQS